MTRKTLLAVTAATAVLAAACGDDPLDIGPFSVEGTWTGSAKFAIPGSGTPLDTARYEIVLELDQSERDVSGSGEVITDAETLGIDVDGRWDYPDVDMVFRAPDFQSVVFDSRFASTPDSLRGTLNGSGFSNVTLVLVRRRDAAASRSPRP